MIKIIDYASMDQYGALFADQFRLRQREFIDRQDYKVSTWKGMEFDQFDNPTTVYCVSTRDGKTVDGLSRFTPVTHGCMLKELWPHLVEDKSQLESSKIWESTRFCIDHRLDPKVRRQICYELSYAHVWFGLREGIEKIIGLMPTFILYSVFEKSGITLERLGGIQTLEGYGKVQAAGIPINIAQIESIQNKTGIRNLFDDEPKEALKWAA